jgi:hypothetical protein
MGQSTLDQYFNLYSKKRNTLADFNDFKDSLLTEYDDGKYKIGEDATHEYFIIIETKRSITHKKLKKKKSRK